MVFVEQFFIPGIAQSSYLRRVCSCTRLRAAHGSTQSLLHASRTPGTRGRDSVQSQWLPPGETVPCTLRRPEGEIAGVCEPAVQGALGRVVQFERVGFARIDSAGPEGVIAYLTHR